MSEFFCEKCKYLFEKNNVPPFKENGAPNYYTSCPKCGDVEASIQYKVNEDIKTHPSNSTDMIVGKESEKRWAGYEERKSMKEKIRKETGNIAVGLEMKKKSQLDKINYEYKTVSKERIQERKALYADYEKSRKDKK